MRTDAAECELDGPRITGPTTSLKMLGGWVVGLVVRMVVRMVFRRRTTARPAA
jgi:hypothetical protein